MIELFSLDGLQKKAAIFDTKKLEWMNGQHLSRSSALELEPRLTPALIVAGVASAETLEFAGASGILQLIDLLKVRARTVLTTWCGRRHRSSRARLYTIPKPSKSSGRTASALRALLQRRAARLADVPTWTPESLEAVAPRARASVA